jgi:hypothetical protein
MASNQSIAAKLTTNTVPSKQKARFALDSTEDFGMVKLLLRRRSAPVWQVQCKA